MTENEQVQTIKGAAGFAAESLFPGGSLALKGDLKEAGIYAILGLAARATFGLPGALLISAAAFTKAMTGHDLPESLGFHKPEHEHEPEHRSRGKREETQ